jgi:hypothetical protein
MTSASPERFSPRILVVVVVVVVVPKPISASVVAIGLPNVIIKNTPGAVIG